VVVVDVVTVVTVSVTAVRGGGVVEMVRVVVVEVVMAGVTRHLRRSGVGVLPSSPCRGGICHACLVVVVFVDLVWMPCHRRRVCAFGAGCCRGHAVDDGHHCSGRIVRTGGPSSCWCVHAAVVVVVVIHLNIDAEDLSWAL